jgi:iron complex outermembrane receptor protein
MMTRHSNQTLVRAIAAALAGSTMLAGLPAIAVAQDATEARAPSVLEEVVVTAQRREQVLQDVPITVQVVSNDLLDDIAAEDMNDLNGFVPGLVVSGDSPTQPKFQIRGIQTSDFGVGTDPAVGVYVDGVYSARSGASLLAFNDIERIEVLKGPQGTLFGRNSAAGAVSIVTRQPADQFDALLKLRVGDNDKQRVEGMVNLPFGDDVALRVNGVWNQSDGWIEDATTGKGLNPEDNWATRAALKWDVTDSTSATLTWDHDEIDQLARPAIGLIARDSAMRPELGQIAFDPEAVEDSRAPYPPEASAYLNPLKAKVHNDVVGNEESRKLDGLTLFIDHEFAWADFRSTTAWRTFETVNREDEDGTNWPTLYFDTANIEDNESLYQEFKFSGQSDRFDWVAGVSYYKEDAKQASDTFAYTEGIDTALWNLGKAGVIDPIATPDGTLFNFTSAVLAANNLPATLLGYGWRETMYNEGSFEAAALFGDVIWHATDRLNLTFGLRYTHDSKEFSWLNGAREAPELDATLAALEEMGFFAEFPIPPQAYQFDLVFDTNVYDEAGNVIATYEGQKLTNRNSWDDLSPRFVIDYEIAPRVMAFGSLTKGYKAGGYNSVEVNSKFDNEDVWSLEGGIKTASTDLNLVFNASTFYYVYYDKQAITLIPASEENPVARYLVDTSDEEAWGVEAEARWQPLEALTLSANVAFIDATYKDKVTREGVDLSGEPTGEPRLSAALGASYVWSLGSYGLLDLSAQHAYRGESRCNKDSQQQGECTISPNFEVGEATNSTDVRLAWSSLDDSWGVAAFVTNLFDNQYVTGVNNLTRDTFGTPFASISEPRMWGVELRKSF